MGIDKSDPVASLDILERHGLDEGGFAGPRLPYDVCVEEAVSVLLSKAEVTTATVCQAKDGDVVGIRTTHPVIIP